MVNRNGNAKHSIHIIICNRDLFQCRWMRPFVKYFNFPFTASLLLLNKLCSVLSNPDMSPKSAAKLLHILPIYYLMIHSWWIKGAFCLLKSHQPNINKFEIVWRRSVHLMKLQTAEWVLCAKIYFAQKWAVIWRYNQLGSVYTAAHRQQ